MSKTTEKDPSFWKELKRRGVPRVMAMYAATAFIIMEAGDIMLPRLGLPDWTVTLIIVLLIVGLPVAFILSWIFDITPQGVVKTEAVKAGESFEEDHRTGRRRLRISDGIIALLLIVVAVLAYPKIFGEGNKRARYSHDQASIAVMPFKNMTGDTLYNLWQGGLQNLLITSLSNSEELAVRQYETMYGIMGDINKLNYASITPSLVSSAARKVDANTVIVGNMYKSGEKVRVTTNIMNADTEEIYKSFEVQGYTEDDFFVLTDSLSLLIRDFLEIRNLKKSTFYDLRKVFTQSSDAYKLFLQGQNCHVRLEYPCAIEYYNKAIDADSNFVSAMLNLSYCYGDVQEAAMSKMFAYKAFDRIDVLPPDMQLMVHAVKSMVDKRPLDQVNYLKQYLEINPQSMVKFYTLGWVIFNMEQWQESIDPFEESLALAKKQGLKSWSWTYILLGRAYHLTGEHKKEQKSFEEGREFWPNQNSTFDYWQAVCAVSQGDSMTANYYLGELRKMTEQRGWPESNLLMWYAGVYTWAESFEKAEEYYREALRLRPDNEMISNDLADILITYDLNVEEGMEIIVPLVEKYPDNVSYLYTYGLGLYKTGKYKEADEVLQKAWDMRAFYDHKHFTLGKKVDDMLNRS